MGLSSLGAKRPSRRAMCHWTSTECMSERIGGRQFFIVKGLLQSQILLQFHHGCASSIATRKWMGSRDTGHSFFSGGSMASSSGIFKARVLWSRQGESNPMLVETPLREEHMHRSNCRVSLVK